MFKQAVGALYKARKITIEASGIKASERGYDESTED
ncbi:hypothetical protein OAR53_04615 [Luminiphilus sp.]|nr:hypothetical protein [Luminiphilus sp.]